MASLDDLKKLAYALKNGVTEQYNQGAPYRNALAQALQGNLQPADQLFNTPQPVNEQQAIDTAMGFAPMGLGTIGKVASKLKPLEQNHLIAQKNAVEMLGLPANNTAMDRAKAMGFDTTQTLYHGGPKFEGGFKVPQTGDKGLYFTNNKDFATDVFALQHELAARDKAGWDYKGVPEEMLESGLWDSKYFKHADVKDVFLRSEKPLNIDSLDAKDIPKLYDNLHDRINVKSTGDFGYNASQSVVFNPNQVRSVNAAFDPAKLHSADIMGFADPALLATIAGGGLIGLAAKDKKK